MSSCKSLCGPDPLEIKQRRSFSKSFITHPSNNSVAISWGCPFSPSLTPPPHLGRKDAGNFIESNVVQEIREKCRQDSYHFHRILEGLLAGQFVHFSS